MAKIYNDFQPANLMSFAKSFARLNGQPLDESEIWYNLAEAKAYAATDAAYVGQILSVIDTDNNKVVYYGINDAAGTLKEVGSTPIGDELSIEIVDGKIQLKGFGKKYYAYVPAVKDDEGNITEESKYVLTEGFKAGLEPRIVVDGEDLIIAWYEPGAETVEDVAANIESVSKTVDKLDDVLNVEGGLVDQVDDLKNQVGQTAEETGGAATGLYGEINRIDEELAKKADSEEVKKAIAAAVAGADHLKREVVDDLPSAENANPNTIYMVPTGLQDDDNKYYEWILIDGIFEPVGSWEVDLSGYAKTADVNTALDKKVDKAEGSRLITNAEAEKLAGIEAGAQVNIINSVSSDFTIDENKKLQLNTIGQDKVNGLTDSLNNKVNKKTSTVTNDDGTTSEVEWTLLSPEDQAKLSSLVIGDNGVEISGKVNADNVEGLGSWISKNKDTIDGLLSTEDSEKLDSIALGAEPNFIKAVVEEEFTVTDGTLALNTIPIAKIANLEDALDVIQSDIVSLDGILNGKTLDNGEVVQGVVGKLNDLTVTVASLSDNLVNYVSVEDFNAVVGNLEEMKANSINIMGDLDEIKEILQWRELEENKE